MFNFPYEITKFLGNYERYDANYKNFFVFSYGFHNFVEYFNG